MTNMSKEDSDAFGEVSEEIRGQIKRNPTIIKEFFDIARGNGYIRKDATLKEYLVEEGFSEADAEDLLRQAGL
jgi:hypothetical protein